MIRFLSSPRRIFLACLTLATVLHLICLRLFYVGYFTDDGLFITLAESLLQGRYMSIYAPLPQPLTDPLPGFPMLLAACLKLAGHSFISLQLFSLMMTALSAYFLYRLQSTWTQQTQAIAISLYFAFNATLVRYAGTVMAEPSYLMFMPLTVWLLLLKKPWSVWAAGLALGMTCLLRPQGVIFFGSVLLALCLQRRMADCLIVGAVAAALISPFFIRNYLLTGEVSGYVTNFERHAGMTFQIDHYLRQLKGVLGLSFPQMVFEIPFVKPLACRRVVAWSSILFALFLIGMGFFKCRKNIAVQIGFLTVIISLATLPLWFSLELRYTLIVLPWMVMVGGVGLKALIERAKWMWVIPVFLLATQIWSNTANVREALANQGPSQKPAGTFQWIKENTPGTAVFLSEKAPVVYLYTNRKCETLFLAKTDSELEERVIRSGISHILLLEGGLSGQAGLPGIMKSRISDWIRRNPAFELVFASPEEKTLIYRHKEPVYL